MSRPHRTSLRGPLVAALVTAIALAAPRQANAWNRGGHMVSGAIAHGELLARDPGAVQATVALLMRHPDYASRWRPQLEARDPAERDALLFMLAARWADDVRGDRRYDHPTWHYVNYPI